MAKVEERQLSTEEFVVKVKDLPAFKQLKEKVDDIAKNASWFEKYAWDNAHFLSGCVFYAAGLAFLASSDFGRLLVGGFLVGLGHSIVTAKIIHLSAHGAMGESELYNKFLSWFSGDFVGLFPAEAGFDIHIREHHPHTNIIGLGDSSTWRMPMLPGPVYLFLAPVLFPAVTPLVGASLLVKKPLKLLAFLVSAGLGLYTFVAIMVHWCGYTPLGGLVTLMLCRSLFSFSYIHINIFQHIGLPMWSQSSRPARLFQMASGVLNLHSNPLLDLAFGHSLISCHVEHHLFPRLSDSMCLRVKPAVRNFLLANNLPYNEDYYYNRLKIFMVDYEKLMVNAPPIWHYVGLQ
ncbi:hypothetical protein BOX15_Mlig001555g5 [Macrostomum lignano]|nr:hypothetical protein BOX15_Mlig001555g1 [Macrostomum lignano]PAA91030.1 hypothetical protein BOX15_Mlig001555g5 [Macrostomum lignano]